MSQNVHHKLKIHHKQHISYIGSVSTYDVLGVLPMDLSHLKVTINATAPSGKRYRSSFDLLSDDALQRFCEIASEKLEINPNLLENDLMNLSDELEVYRNELFYKEMGIQTEEELKKQSITPEAEKQAVRFAQSPNLLDKISQELKKAGIIGEENNKMVAFIIGSSHMSGYSMHGLVQGASGSGKTHLIDIVSKCLPQKSVMSLTTSGAKTMYNFRDEDLNNKLLIIQDFDGLNKESELSLRELQSSGRLDNGVTKNPTVGGESRAIIKTLRANIASLSATTKNSIYYDNQSRSICIAVDESIEQSKAIVKYEARKLAGKVTNEDEENARTILKNYITVLKPLEVINPFAEKLKLPIEVDSPRRLYKQFHNFLSQITLLHQFQRKQDGSGRLIATIDDVKSAIEILFSSIILKVDELSGSTREFYDKLCDLIQKEEVPKEFKSSDLIKPMQLNRTRVHEQLKALKKLEYIYPTGGHNNRGIIYELSGWDLMSNGRREKIKEELFKQIDKIKD